MPIPWCLFAAPAADSAEGAQDSFGDPREYARNLRLPPSAAASGLALLRSIMPIIVQVLGMIVLLWSFSDWRGGDPLEITGGRLVVLALTALAALALVRWADPVLRLAVDHPVLLWCVVMASIASYVVPLLLVDAVLARVGAGWGVGLGAAAIVGAVGWVIARRRTDDFSADPIISPFVTDRRAAGSGTVAGAGTSMRPAGLTALVTHPAALVPIGTLVILPVMWWLTR